MATHHFQELVENLISLVSLAWEASTAGAVPSGRSVETATTEASASFNIPPTVVDISVIDGLVLRKDILEGRKGRERERERGKEGRKEKRGKGVRGEGSFTVREGEGRRAIFQEDRFFSWRPVKEPSLFYRTDVSARCRHFSQGNHVRSPLGQMSVPIMIGTGLSQSKSTRQSGRGPAKK